MEPTVDVRRARDALVRAQAFAASARRIVERDRENQVAARASMLRAGQRQRDTAARLADLQASHREFLRTLGDRPAA
ncbi:hypothetical protein [Nocardia blacklockiae]|uniref:hypothetical protein n=1 Tax=Nocardia blacklockiae TaxID=480036 RepID=UPI0018938BFE|nr:hypothetical protein [Nocardia blacklockiae]MBF6175070.1 hypothetical protein [Nocardia blacklockiae]